MGPEWISPTRHGLRLAAARCGLRLRQRLDVLTQGPEPSGPFLILATPRSGSTLLADYCNSVRGVSCGKEMLNPYSPYGIRDWWIGKGAVLRHVVRSLRWQNAAHCGAKVMLQQLEAHGLTVGDLCGVLPGLRIVVIYRRDLGRQVVSLKRAQHTRQWAVRDPTKVRRARLRLQRQELLDEYASVRGHYERLLSSSSLEGRSVLLSYEELVADPQGIFESRVLPLLGLEATTIETRLVKIGPDSLREAVANYDELEDVLTGPRARQEYALAQRM